MCFLRYNVNCILRASDYTVKLGRKKYMYISRERDSGSLYKTTQKVIQNNFVNVYLGNHSTHYIDLMGIYRGSHLHLCIT